MTKKIRVLLADDSAMARGMLRNFLEEEGDFEVVGEARHGEEAVELACSLRPDLITMDLEMPTMGGMEAIREIMSRCAVPILVVSDVADARNAYKAVSMGALEVVRKPSTDGRERREFVNKARLVSGVKVITHVRALRAPALPRRVSEGAAATSAPVQLAMPLESPSDTDHFANRRVFVIASSTGGPQALAEILGSLPVDFPCPILIAQHISAGFAAGMADWLATLSRLPVLMGQEGNALIPGVVMIAPSEYHMSVDRERHIRMLKRGEQDVYRPCCDILLESVAAVYGERSVGIILTGMGRDGANGMLAIQAAGGHTIAQDEASSVVFGMNGVAIQRGAIQQTLPLNKIAASMEKLARESL